MVYTMLHALQGFRPKSLLQVQFVLQIDFTPFSKRTLSIDPLLFQSTVFLLNHEWFSHTRIQALTRAGNFNFIKIKHKINSLNQQFQSLTLSLSLSLAVFSLSLFLSLSLSLSLSLFLCLYCSLSLFLSPSVPGFGTLF